MWMSHVTPEQAIKAGQDLNADILVAGHWGTIELSDEDHWEPPKRFLAAAEKAGIDKEKAWVMKIGETRILPKKLAFIEEEVEIKAASAIIVNHNCQKAGLTASARA